MMSRPAPKHAPRVPFALLLVGLLVGGLSVLLMLNTASAANEVRRHDLALRDAGVSAHVEQLRNEIARSQAPGNLAQVAAGLGMVPAGNPAFLELGADGTVTVLGHPAPVFAAAGAAPASVANQVVRTNGHKKKTHSKTRKTTSAKPTAAKAGATKTTAASAGAHHRATARHPSGAATSSPAPTPTTTLPGGAR